MVNSKSGNLGWSIKERTEQRPSGASSTVYTNLDYGIYYELGTGPNGQEKHAGISPNVNPKYSQTGWMIPADAMSVDDAEYYGLGVVESVVKLSDTVLRYAGHGRISIQRCMIRKKILLKR